MYNHLGENVSRFPVLWLIFWILFSIGIIVGNPNTPDIYQDGEFAFLPENAPSQQARRLYLDAFGGAPQTDVPEGEEDGSSVQQDPLGSSIVIVLEREDRAAGLTDEDRRFITETLVPRLTDIQQTTSRGYDFERAEADKLIAPISVAQQVIRTITTLDDERIGTLLTSPDKQATMVVIDLKTEFLERQNALVLGRIEDALELLANWRPVQAAADVATDQLKITSVRASASSRPYFAARSPAGLPVSKYRLVNSERVRVSSSGTLPGGLSDKDSYYIVNAGTEGFQLATEPGGQPVDLADAGSGELTLDLAAPKPNYLLMALSGSATVGRDMLRAERESASRTEAFTKGLCIVLLLLIYRAPLLALVPLVTVGVSVQLSQALLRMMTHWGWIGMFTGLDVYVTVVVYGAGVDFCLFLIARYKEELDHGSSHQQAMAESIRRVGAALATSAGTSIIGIGMMQFSDFGKFRQAGFAISFGLLVVLCFALTFTPAFLLIFGRWVFWPNVREERPSEAGGWLPASKAWNRASEQRLIDRFWDWIADHLQKRPGLIFLGTVAVMMPFAIIGTYYQNHLSYGLLSDLPQDDPSVVGAKAVQEHFPPGVTGPISLFVKFDKAALEKNLDGRDLSSVPAAAELSKKITENLQQFKGPLGIDDIRNQTNPLGTRQEALDYLATLTRPRERNAVRVMAHRTYTATKDGPVKGQVMRLDVVLSQDPFARDTIYKLGDVEAAIAQSIPAEFRDGAVVHALGTTAGIRDIKTTTDHDRVLIDTLVTIAVFILIVILLRQWRLCLYLIASVIFSFVVTLGVTYVVFALRDPAGFWGFAGLDWKIPVYLFTILVAMGEDYNILLMSRVQEEQEKHGYVGGVLFALRKTGGIISSCGIIMAGTFFSLMSGTLLGMVEMGFALGFGVLLDTFIVRPILVPAYLILLYSGKMGWFGRLLGAPADAGKPEEPPAEDLLTAQSA